MNEKKNIDKLFKEQLKNFDVAPKDYVWENIEEKLHEDKRKKRRVIPIWWRVAGIAAGLVLLVTITNQFFNTSDTDGISKDTIVNESKTNNNSNSQDENNTLDQNDPSKVILENDTEEQIVDANSKTIVEEGQSSVNKNKSNVITSENKENPLVASESTNRDKLKEKTQNSIATNTNDYEKSQKDEKNSNNNLLTKDAVASTTKTSSKTIQNTQNTIKDKSEIDVLLKSTKEDTNVTVANVDTKDKDSVTNTLSKTNKSTQNTIKDKSEIDALLKSTQTGIKATVAKTDIKDKDALEKDNSTIEDTQNKEIEKEEKEEVNAIENAIAEAENTEELEEEEEKLNRWSVSPSVAPVYFSSLGEGSSLDNQFIENTKESEINMSYGIKGSYALNKKLKIRAGINKVQLGYKTNDVLIFENTNPVARGNRQIANVNLVDSMSQHSIYSARNFKFENAPATLFTQELGSLDQQLSFIEVPVELEYNLVESKLGLNLIGGFSALILSDNDVYAVLNNGDRSRLGEASNVKDLSYTANIGIGVDYNFSKQFQFNLEPTFKYQINTFNNTSGDFKPFFIGVYTGLSFKF
ncbi:hypothetical protein [Psychroserpens jangbogonensis]|uniref:hypothetical protein n=1 Tax=Psychroserpens jangbogonensis TaxID=1484460 RepID=UPI00053E821D|nr:hypothetical protein [Psychroserpens jangbogonensis]